MLVECALQDGSTPLNAAASSGHDAVVRLLLESKAVADTANKVSVAAEGCCVQACIEAKGKIGYCLPILFRRGTDVDGEAVRGGSLICFVFLD